MKGLLKFLVMAAVVIFAGFWIMAIAKSCNSDSITKVGDVTDKAGELVADGTDAVKNGIDDLTSDDDDDENEFDDAEFDEDGDEVLDDDDDMDEEGDGASFDDDDEDDEDLDDENVTKNNGSSTSGSSSASSGFGNYLVVTGSFLGEENAKKEVRRLKKLGYNNAEVVEFDFSQYHSVCVKRTNSLSDARATKNQLVDKHSISDAYVHKKRKSKRKG